MLETPRIRLLPYSGNNAGAMRTISRKGLDWRWVTTMEHKENKEFKRAIRELKRLKGHQRNWFVSGFVDGEGSFNVSFARQSSRPTGFLINPKFQVYQHRDHEEILWFMKDVLGAGRIDKKWGTDVRVLTIENRKTLQEKIIPFFQKYFLITKRKTFGIFVDVINRMEQGEHLTLDGFLNIVNLSYHMNQHGKARKIPKMKLIQEIKSNFRQFKNPQRLHAGP